MAKRLTAFRNRGWRIATTILLAVGCCAMWLPVPQVSSPGKDRSEPYPCMDRPCGCASAEQCWKKCCCFTNQEKISWAERTGVKVPEYAVAAAGREKAQKTAATAAPKCEHCVAASADSAASATTDAAVTSKKTNLNHNAATPELCGVASETNVVRVDDEPSSACCDAEQTTPVKEATAKRRQDADERAPSYFCGIAALECQGLTSLFQILSLTMLPEKSCPEIEGEDMSSNVPAFDVLVCSCEWPPPEPPPRIGVAGFRAVQA